MLDKIKTNLIASKNKVIGATASGAGVLAVGSTTALASGTNDTVQNLTTGMSGFVSLVTTMIETIMGSPTLQIAFAASFAFLAVRLIRRLKKT